MANKFDLRQTEYRGTLDQIGNQVTPEGDNLLKAINAQLTPLLRMSAAASPSLVVSVGGGDLTDAETNRRRAIPHVGTAYVQFTSGTVTFPAASGGNIVCSPGVNTVLTIASGNYAAVLIYLDGTGGLNALPGADSAVLNTAITNLPPSPDETLPLGFIVVQNVAGVIQNITQANIAQFGTGTGGGGSGNVTAVETALRDYNNFAQTRYLDPNIFRQSKATKVDGSSTGVFDLVKNAFKFTSIGNTFVSTNLANAEFLAEGVDITDIHLYNHWLLGFIDTAATYEASRDGGTNWSTITMQRVGTASNAYRGYLQFADESVQQSVVTVAPTGAGSALNATTQQMLSSQLVLSSTTVIRSIDLSLNYGGVGTGTFSVRIVKNNAGSPSTAVGDILSESNAQAISVANLGTGNVTENVVMPQVVLTAGTYHIVILTDAAYKAGTLDLSWRSGAGTNGANFDGSVWTSGQASKAFVAKGRVHDLRIRITAGTALTYLEGMGVYFPSDEGMLRPNGTKYVQRFYFSGDSGRTSFDLNWVPDPDLLDIIDPYRGQIYTIEPGVAQINGQNVTFAPGTFSFPGESIALIFRQVKGVGIDNSDSNAAAISTNTQNIQDIGDMVTDLEYVVIPKIAVPNTAIVNRAQIPDLTQDLATRFGIERMPTQNFFQIQNEVGSNGEMVWGVTNDRNSSIRLVGSGWHLTVNDGPVGPGLVSVTANDYMEVTFYGTGLNMLTQLDAAARDDRATVDGGVEGANFIPNASTSSGVLNNRNYAMNIVVPVVSGLTLGLHTVKIRCAAVALTCYAIEILNENTALRLNPGAQIVRGQRRSVGSQQTLAYNSGFETGTLGTRGGRVLIYQKLDGSIGRALQPTDAASATLASATHANEELVRNIYFREFGVGFSTDFTAQGTGFRRFTLDDDTTTLVASNQSTEAINSRDMVLAASGTFIELTFIGTGLDIIAGSSGARNTNISIDGAAPVNIVTSGATGQYLQKIVSGLPYGTHTVRFTGNGASSLSIAAFMIYQPKTPTLPAFAKSLGAYNLMADFATAGTAGVSTIATGVMRKYGAREFGYYGTWTSSDTSNVQGGIEFSTSTNASFFEYTFFGTGFEWRFENNAAAAVWNVTIDGATNLSGFTSTTYGAGITSFVAATGTLNISASATIGNGLRITALSLGKHTVRFTRTSGAGTQSHLALDVVTPVHSYKASAFITLTNASLIGSNNIEDFRRISPTEKLVVQKSISVARSTQSSNPTTSSTSLIPLPDMSLVHYATTGQIEINFTGTFLNGSTSQDIFACIAIDGIPLGGTGGGATVSEAGASQSLRMALSHIIPVSPGAHRIDIYWRVSGGTAASGSNISGLTGDGRAVMTVKDL